MTQIHNRPANDAPPRRLAQGRSFGRKDNKVSSAAKGSMHSRMPCRLWVSIGFDDETFAELRTIAIAENRSVNSVVRELVEFGLETRKEGGQS